MVNPEICDNISPIYEHKQIVVRRLTAFLYLLMRDRVPTGDVCQIIMDIGESSEFEFTSKHLEALARDYADRIIGECWEP